MGQINLNSFKVRLGAVVIIVTIILSSAGLFTPRPAEAFVTTVIGDIVTAGEWIWQQVKSAAEFAWKHGAAVAYRNTVRNFATGIASDIAENVVSGDIGQRPLFQTINWKAHLKNTTDDTIGDLIDEYSKEDSFGRFGLCERPEFSIGSGEKIGDYLPNYDKSKINIGLSLGSLFRSYKKPPRVCDLADIKENWETIKHDADILNRSKAFLDPQQTDLGAALEMQRIAQERVAADQKAEELQLSSKKGIKDVKEPISGNIKTPSSFLESQVNAGLEGAIASQTQPTFDPVADAVGAFTQTLASRLIKRLFQQGLVPNPTSQGPSSLFGSLGGVGGGGVEYAIQVNSSIATPQLVVDQPFDIIGQLSNCPTDIRFANVYNCTLNSRFEQLLRQADEGKLLTVKEAIEAGGINGGWLFKGVRPSNLRSADAWYLTDIKKLRQARIMPVGWELAVENFKGQDITLKQVMDNFDNCTDDPVTTNIDEARYCHLVDPNWILRAPQAQCRIQGPGQILEQRSANRQESCVDIEQCVAENEDGTCQSWGYCVAEKNSWRFGGNSCEFPQGSGYSPYATCQTFSTSAGGSISLLTNSVQNYDDGVCSQSAGCKWYSKAFNPNNLDQNRYGSELVDRIYLKNLNKIPCNANDEGCTEFLRISSIDTQVVSGVPGNNPAEQLVNKVVGETDATYVNYASVRSEYLKQAPDYLHCYDVDSFGRPITSNDSNDCKKYLSWCSADELGCDNYKPIDGSPSVPAVIQAGDSCPKECVGLNGYVKGGSYFDQAAESLPFIPTTAKNCPAQYAGCSEFTNLEQPALGEQKEYYSQLQQCIKDDDDRAKTYYTWVGSDLTGFQLKTWRLQSSNKDDLTAPPQTPTGDCSVSFGTNPDCKQFYSVSGSIAYRLAAEVITASNSCARYRATSVREVECQPNINGGSWDVAVNACIFNAIPGEGKKCEAQYNGCREFRGPTATNIKLMFPISTFGDQDVGSSFTIDSSSTGGWEGGANSNESLSAFGHSYDSGNDGLIERKLKDQNVILTPGKQYLLTFWAKQYSSTSNVGNDISPSFTIQVSSPITFDWAEYKVTVAAVDGANYDIIGLRFTGSPRLVIDNISFRENTDTFFVNKNSWTTPSSCLAPSGNSPYLGCAAYKNKDNNTFTLHSFSRLCRAAAAGCEALIDTKNSTSPRSEIFTAGGQTVTVADDVLVYRTYDKSKTCQSQAKACQRVGEPALDAVGTATTWGDKFVKLNPDTFSSTNPTNPLCGVTEDRCQVFKDSQGAIHYFKDPGAGLCEYKQLNALQGYGWYKKGTNEPCNLLDNPSFEQASNPGINWLKNGSFESFTSSTPDNWTVVNGSWNKASVVAKISPAEASYSYSGQEGVAIVTAPNELVTLRQTVSVVPNKLYTARVWAKGDYASQRGLHISGCGLSLWDASGYKQDWEELAVTFVAAGSTCNFDIVKSYNAGRVYFDEAQLTLAEDFTNWHSNDAPGAIVKTTIIQDDSLPGKYWGGYLLKVKSTSEQYSGVWSGAQNGDEIDIGVKSEARYFTISANIFVPDIGQNKAPWMLDFHATPPGGCQVRTLTGNYACHHGDYINWDMAVSNQEKGRWVYKYATMKVDPGVRFISVGVITNGGKEISPGVYSCTVDSCFAGQLAYIDQVSVFESISPFVYSCPTDQSSCTGFRDPDLTNKVYYYLNDKKLDRSSCGGQVSTKEGCLLFADLSQSATPYRAHDTYVTSQNNNNRALSPVVANTAVGEKGDTNSVLKVNRNRVCGEWLACQSEAIKYEASGTSKSICYALGRCDQYGSQGTSKCGNWKTVDDPQVLTAAAYRQRGVNWSDQDLSGYSIPGTYPVDSLRQKNYRTAGAGDPDIRLTYIDKNGDDIGVDGRGEPKPTDNYSNTISKSCRLYPELDSPFPAYLATFVSGGENQVGGGNISKKEPSYKDANICQTGENCECSYQRVKYQQGEVRFYNFDSVPAESILVNKEGEFETRSRKQEQSYLLGLRGYCLEKDQSRLIDRFDQKDNACLTWLPMDVVSGDASIYDYAADAGFNKANAYYCSEARGLYNLGKTSSGFGLLTNGYTIQSYVNDVAGHTFSGYNIIGEDFPANHVYSPPWPDNTLNEKAIDKIDIKFLSDYCPGGNWINCGQGLGVEAWFGNGDGGNVRLLNKKDPPELNYAPDVPDDKRNNYIAYEFSYDGTSSTSNILEVGILFNKATGLLKYIKIHTNHYAPGVGGMVGAIRYHVREYCSEVIRASDPQGKNKAWTNRVLMPGAYTVLPQNELGINNFRDRPPFGVIESFSSDLLVLSDIYTGPTKGFKTITTPFACAGNCGGVSKPGVCLNSLTPAETEKTCSSSSECKEGTGLGVCGGYINSYCSGGGRDGLSCSSGTDCPAGTCNLYRGMSSTSAGKGIGRLQELFARVYGVSHWQGLNWSNLLPIDNDDISGSKGQPVVVNQVNFDAAGKPVEGSYGFSLSALGKTLQSGQLAVKSPSAVQALFYAYNPNGEQMPLTEVRVDWNGSGADNTAGGIGKYKNHKHVCAPQTFKDANGNDIPNPNYNFGDTSDACIDDSGEGAGYFNFTSVLTCPVNGGSLKLCTDPSRGASEPCWNISEQYCEYRPRVYVEDNWEWCTKRPTMLSTKAYGNICDPKYNYKDWLSNTWLPFGNGFSDRIIVYP